VSVEADVFPENKPARWNLIDGTIGEGSPFHATFGYCARRVDETTALLPRGMEDTPGADPSGASLQFRN